MASIPTITNALASAKAAEQRANNLETSVEKKVPKTPNPAPHHEFSNTPYKIAQNAKKAADAWIQKKLGQPRQEGSDIASGLRWNEQQVKNVTNQ